MAGALPPACSRAPFPFRANIGWPRLLACLQHISQLIFLNPLLFLEAEIPSIPQPRVLAAARAERWLLESCAGAGVDGGKPNCCPALDEAWC